MKSLVINFKNIDFLTFRQNKMPETIITELTWSHNLIRKIFMYD